MSDLEKSNEEPVFSASAAVEGATSPLPSMKRPRRRVMLNVLYSIFTRAQGAVFTYVTTYLLLKAMNVDEYGLYTVLFSGTTGTLLLVGRLGIPNLLMRFIPEYYLAGRWRLLHRLFHASNLLQTGFALLLLVVAFIFAPLLCRWLGYPGSELLLRIFAVGIFSHMLAENYRVLLSSVFLHSAIFWRNLFYNILRLAALLIATRQANPLLAVVIAEAVVWIFSLGLYVGFYRRFVTPRVEADPHAPMPPEWKRYKRYTAISYLNELGVMLIMSATDIFLVSGFLGGVAVGLFGLANRIMTVISHILPSNFLSVVMTPLFFSEYGAEEHKHKANFGFNLLMKIGLIITIPVGVWLALIARPLIVNLFDPRYADAAQALAWMGLFMPADALRYPLGLMLQNAERNDLLLYCKVTGVLKIAVGVFWLSHGGGIVAMVVTTGLAVVAQNAMMYFWIVTKLKTTTDVVGLVRMAINGAVAGALFYPLVPYFSGVVGVIASVPAFSVLYIGISLLHKSFSAEERAFINGHIKYPLWKF